VFEEGNAFTMEALQQQLDQLSACQDFQVSREACFAFPGAAAAAPDDLHHVPWHWLPFWTFWSCHFQAMIKVICTDIGYAILTGGGGGVSRGGGRAAGCGGAGLGGSPSGRAGGCTLCGGELPANSKSVA
jgi:hypothetical protein